MASHCTFAIWQVLFLHGGYASRAWLTAMRFLHGRYASHTGLAAMHLTQGSYASRAWLPVKSSPVNLYRGAGMGVGVGGGGS